MAAHTIVLNKDNSSYAIPLNQVASPGDSIKFHTDEGAFSIKIINAISFLDVPEHDLKISIDNTNRDSDEYTVRNIDADAIYEYNIYSITKNDWPDAPPKIIIIVRR